MKVSRLLSAMGVDRHILSRITKISPTHIMST